MQLSLTHFMNSCALLSTQNVLHTFWPVHTFTLSVLTLGSTHGNWEKSTERCTGLNWWLTVISDYWSHKQQSNAYSWKHYHQTILSNKIFKKLLIQKPLQQYVPDNGFSKILIKSNYIPLCFSSGHHHNLLKFTL